MISLPSNDRDYHRWCDQNPSGFVLNAHRNVRPEYIVLHTATCYHIRRPREPGAYTERQYIKVCSQSIEELREWAKSHGRLDGSFSVSCPTCSPGYTVIAAVHDRTTPSSEQEDTVGSKPTVAADFRDNLIIDRYDPVFTTMRARKRKHLSSRNSEDVVTWNVFRSLRQIDSRIWLPRLFRAAFPSRDVPADMVAVVDLWRTMSPPPSLLLTADEGESEIDVVIETADWVWFIEAKLTGDISMGTTTRPDRNQVLRNIDVGSYYAGVRPFYFSLLITDDNRSRAGVKTIEEYRDLRKPRELLADHRPDGLTNLRGISLIRWRDLGAVLNHAKFNAEREYEAGYAERAFEWMKSKGLVGELSPTPV